MYFSNMESAKTDEEVEDLTMQFCSVVKYAPMIYYAVYYEATA